jgi:hypothetical protein
VIRFVGGTVGGIAITTYHDVRVHIRHELREGYLPSANGDMIREEMPLREFLGRIFKEGREVENELYRVSKCMSGGYSYNDNELDRIIDTYNTMYAELIRRGKLVLPAHKIRQNMLGGVDPYNELQRRQAMSGAQQMDSEHYRRQAMMQQMSARPNPGQFLGVMQEDPSIKKMHKEALEKDQIKQEKKKRDDDLYYLLT